MYATMNRLTNHLRLKSYSFNRHLTTWSLVASAFNSRSFRVKSLKSQFLGERTGLFNYAELQEPNGFYILKDNAVSKSELLVREILSSKRCQKMVSIFDELSDTLCKAADLAECVRQLHPQEKFSYAARVAFTSICNVVEEFNINRDLYLKLKYVIENGDVCPTDDTDKYVAKLFLLDFEQSGIHLDEKTREKIVQYNEHILHVASQFFNKALAPRVVLKSQLPKSILKYFSGEGETVVVGDIYSDCKDELFREAAYKIFLYPERQQQELFEELLQERQNLAELCGFPTYAHRALQESIAGTPEFVHEFLRLTSEKIKPIASEEYSYLLKLKQQIDSNAKSLMPWDVPYLINISKHKGFNLNISDYSPYFSLGACMEGLNYIFNTLYNVTLNVEEVADGEIWHEDVKKLSVSEGNEVLGYIYCDFFERPNKSIQDCHFTVRGGRLCSDGSYQKPIVVLSLNFPNPSLTKPSLLSHCMVENLFHEMGHAMHSMLARTTYQQVTGTRCATDLAEVPSILMEYFASDPRVLTKFARHYKTGETIPMELVKKLQSSKKMFFACEMQLQVFYAAVDQACHSNNCHVSSITDLLPQIQNLYYGLPHVPDTAWHLRFSHLCGYGAKYYSYLMSRAVASFTWYQYFNDNPLNEKEGRRYRSELLAHGGGKPPRQLVEQFLRTSVTPESLSDALLKDISLNYNMK